jgi:16S rRNA (guanine966-N2)-methyltransferase
MGLEALSRGAASTVFVEAERDACRAIQRNLAKLGLQGAEVVCRDALGFLAAERRRFDLILVDPPYELVESLAMRLAVYLPHLLADNGLVALESSSRLEPQLPPLELRTSRRYGVARVTLFERRV